MELDKIISFFRKIDEINEDRKKQIENGLNDHNVMTSLLRQSDEVRLHSRFIYSLINPNGKHYKGTLFLEKFLDVVGIKDFNLKYTEVKKEFENIDLYITDGCKHIIIENKIWANDQVQQLEKYIKFVISECIADSLTAEELYQRIYVVYLTPTNRTPSKESLGIWSLNSSKELTCTNTDNDKKNCYHGVTLPYTNITYVEHIYTWLSNLMDLKNIGTNLEHSISSYHDVVARLTKQKGSNVMGIEEYLLDDKNVSDLVIAGEVSKKFDSIKPRLLLNFFNNVKESVISHEANHNITSADNISNISEFVYSHGSSRCEKWYSDGRDKEYYIGTYFSLNDKIQFGVMVAKHLLHIVVMCDEATYISLANINANLKKEFPKRDWKASNKTFSYYSKSTVYNLFQNIDKQNVLRLMSDKNSMEFLQLIDDLINIKALISRLPVDATPTTP